MAAFTSKATGNWTSAGQTTWNEVGVPGAGDTASIGTGHAITLDQTSPESVTCTSITIAGTGTLVIPAATTFTINANITSNGTADTGAIIVGTGQGLIVNGQITQSGNGGRCIVPSGNGNVTISNVGGTAVECASGNYLSGGIVGNSSGTVSVTGDVLNATTGNGVNVGGNGNVTINGSVSNSGTGYAVRIYQANLTVNGNVFASNGWGIHGPESGYTITINGNMSSSGLGVGVYVNIGTVSWTGARTLASGTSCYIQIQTGTLALATASAALVLNNYGNFVINKTGAGTITKTAAGGTASVINNTVNATAAILGDGVVSIITGPVVPAANKVKLGEAQFGYAASLLTPDYYPPNLDADPGVEDDGAVLTTAHYGEANAIVGTASGGTAGAPVFGGHIVRRV